MPKHLNEVEGVVENAIDHFDGPTMRYTVEELNGFKFIATRWEKDACLEVDRDVKEFETYGGAIAQVALWLAEDSGLDIL